MRLGVLMVLGAAAWMAAARAADLTPMAVGHEFRQDDLPSIAAGSDGSLWVAWLSFAGDRDDIALRRYAEGRWSNLQWVPGTSGDSWLPQVGVDGANRVWVVWSQQAEGNWDLYARRFDPAGQSWGPLERLSSHPLPDINPRMAGDGRGRLAVVWQGFRGKHSNIFLRTLEGEAWSEEVRVTNHAANDWEPAVALDSGGGAWMVYDTYRNGNYDVFVSRARAGRVEGRETPLAATAGFEARATVAVDSADRVWAAWESGPANWGKDQGYIIRDRQSGALLDGVREIHVRCLEGGAWKQPGDVPEFQPRNSHQPHLFSDGRGGVWLAAKRRRDRTAPEGTYDGYIPHYQRGFWDYAVSRFDGARWSEPAPLPDSRGRLSTRISGAALPDGTFWLAWPSDDRSDGQQNRPLRARVFAASLAAPPVAGALRLRTPREDAVPAAPPGHASEAADLDAIRSYRITVGGRKLGIYRGDFHRHTELSWDVGGGFDGSLQDFYRYMMDAASMDFGASTDHQGGNWPYWWWYTQKMTDMHHVPGSYVPIFGYERSALYPNGHRNIFYARRSEARMIPFFLKSGAQGFGLPAGPMGDEPSGTGELAVNDTKLLYEEMRPRRAIAISHTSGNRMGTDWRDNDPDLEPVVEIFQGCRTSYEQVGAPYVADPVRDAAHTKVAGYHPDGMVTNAWAKGYKLGIIASSDHFSTHISYAMVWTDDATRQGILNAIRKRHTYGATDNIILEVRMGDHLMGDEFEAAGREPLRVKARGTAEIARVDVIRDGSVVYSVNPGRREVSFDYADAQAGGGRRYYYVRLLQRDGMIAWSSPLFLK